MAERADHPAALRGALGDAGAPSGGDDAFLEEARRVLRTEAAAVRGTTPPWARTAG